MTEETVNLCVGAPGAPFREKCAQLIQEATAIRMDSESRNDAHLLKYGIPEGDNLFISELKKFLSHNYGEEVDEENLVATAGASSGLFYLLNILFPDKCAIFCEELTYHIAINVFASLNCGLHPVAFDKNGIIPEDLERKCTEVFGKQSSEKDRKLNGCLYLIPTYHNPTGRVLSPEYSRKVVEIARRHKLLVICDDVYNILHYAQGNPPKRLFSYDSNPLLHSGGCLNMHMSGVIASAMQREMVQPFVDAIKVEYKKRLEVCVETLRTNLPDECTFEQPQGGYFIWINLKQGQNASQLSKICNEKYNVTFQPGTNFNAGLNKSKYANSFRIAFTFYDSAILKDALKKICKEIKSL